MGVWRWCGDDRDDVRMTGMTWEWQGWHGEEGEDATIMINMLAAIYNFLRVCVHACIHVHVCAHVWGHPPSPHHPPTPLQSCREPKTPKFNKSIINWDNLILFEDSLPLNIPELIKTIVDHPRHPPPTRPTPKSRGNPNQKNYNNSWTNQDNSILFEDLGPLNLPAHI